MKDMEDYIRNNELSEENIDDNQYSLIDLVEYWFEQCMNIYEDENEYTNENKRIADYQEAYTTYLFYEKLLRETDITYRIADKVEKIIKHIPTITAGYDSLDYAQKYVANYGLEIHTINESEAVDNIIQKITEQTSIRGTNSKQRVWLNEL